MTTKTTDDLYAESFDSRHALDDMPPCPCHATRDDWRRLAAAAEFYLAANAAALGVRA
jgi:hypothetical protein